MKLNAFALVTAIGIRAVSAQLVTWLSPPPGTVLLAGEPFTATVKISSTTSSVNTVALAFGLRFNDSDPIPSDLGQTFLGTVNQPTFVTGEDFFFVNSSTLTIPNNVVNGLNQNYELVVAQFFTIGATNTPSIFTDQVQIFISS